MLKYKYKKRYNYKDLEVNNVKFVKNYRKTIGKKGELLAENFLIKEGYNIICKNFYTKKGEIDIIAQKSNELIFIEVKTRTNYKYGTPGMAINNKKKKNIKYVAKIFLYLNNCLEKYTIRFDVIEIMIKNNNKDTLPLR